MGISTLQGLLDKAGPYHWHWSTWEVVYIERHETPVRNKQQKLTTNNGIWIKVPTEINTFKRDFHIPYSRKCWKSNIQHRYAIY